MNVKAVLSVSGNSAIQREKACSIMQMEHCGTNENILHCNTVSISAIKQSTISIPIIFVIYDHEAGLSPRKKFPPFSCHLGF